MADEQPQPPQEKALPTHAGSTIGPDDDLFVAAPAEIGEVLSASTSLKKNQEPRSPTSRMTIAAVVGIVLAVVALAITNAYGSYRLSQAEQLGWPLGAWAVGALIGWLASGFRHSCTYVGRNGVAEFSCRGSRENLTKQAVFTFTNATELRTSQTRHYTNGVYTQTTYTYNWTDQNGANSYAIKGAYRSEKGTPKPTDRYHFACAAEVAWSLHYLERAQAELKERGSVHFALDGENWVDVGPGFVELSFRGQAARCDVADIAQVSINQGTFTIKRKDAKVGWFSSNGVFSFQYGRMANAKVFLFSLDKLAGFRFGG
jgi:hypothetical protein